MKKIVSLSLSFLILVFLFIVPVIIIQAASVPVSPCPAIQGILNRVLSIFNGIVAGVAAIMFAWGGFLYLTARGEPAKVSAAHKILIWGVVGIAILLLSETIPNWVGYIVGGVGAGCPTT